VIILDLLRPNIVINFLQWSKIAETIKVNRTISPLRVRHQWVPSLAALFKFTILSFRYTPPVGKVLRIKISLKYGICVRFASCPLVITFRHFWQLFNVFLFLIFFIFCDFYACLERGKLHDAVMTFQFFQLIWRGFIIITFATPATLPTNEPKISYSGRIGNILSRFATVNIRFFVNFFFFIFMPIPIFVLVFITA